MEDSQVQCFGRTGRMAFRRHHLMLAGRITRSGVRTLGNTRAVERTRGPWAARPRDTQTTRQDAPAGRKFDRTFEINIVEDREWDPICQLRQPSEAS